MKERVLECDYILAVHLVLVLICSSEFPLLLNENIFEGLLHCKDGGTIFNNHPACGIFGLEGSNFPGGNSELGEVKYLLSDHYFRP